MESAREIRYRPVTGRNLASEHTIVDIELGDFNLKAEIRNDGQEGRKNLRLHSMFSAQMNLHPKGMNRNIADSETL